MNYDNNIQLIRNIRDASIGNPPCVELPGNQYYALMVVDNAVRDRGGNKMHGDARQFFDQSKGWIGLECMTGGAVYISKDFYERYNRDRGETWIVSVADASRCYVMAGRVSAYALAKDGPRA